MNGMEISNTRWMHEHAGWKGMLIEACPSTWAQLLCLCQQVSQPHAAVVPLQISTPSLLRTDPKTSVSTLPSAATLNRCTGSAKGELEVRLFSYGISYPAAVRLHEV